MSENNKLLDLEAKSLPNTPTTIGIRRRFNYLRREFGYNDDYFMTHISIDKTDLLLMKTGYYPKKETTTEKVLQFLEIYEPAYLAFLKKGNAMHHFIQIF